MRLLSLLLIGALSCAGKVRPGCTDNEDCGAGAVCRERSCVPVCEADLDCDGPRICNDNLCVVGTRVGPPRIGNVDGDGTADATGSPHARHHIARAVVVHGENLSGAAVELRDAAGERRLTLGEGTDSQLIALLPPDLIAGTYVLHIANHIGADQEAVTVLQGEPGPPGASSSEQALDDTTIAVPGDYPGLQNALNSLRGKIIRDNATVSIRIAAGTYDITQPVRVRHLYGERLEIIGDVTNPANVTLSFTGTSGLKVEDNSALGLLDGVRIVGDDTADTHGVLVGNGGSLTAGSAVEVDGFGGCGVYTNRGSRAKVKRMVATNNGLGGFCVDGASWMNASNATADANGDGFVASNGSMMLAEGATASNNLGDGFRADGRSAIYAPEAMASTNKHGFRATVGSTLEADTAQAIDNRGNGFVAHRGAIVDAPNAVARGNGVDIGEGDGFYASEGATINAAGASTISENNQDAGFRVELGSTLRAINTTANANGSHGFVADTGSTMMCEGALSEANGVAGSRPGRGFLVSRGSTLHAESARADGNFSYGFDADEGSHIFARTAASCGNGAAGAENFRPGVDSTGRANSHVSAESACENASCGNCP